MTFTFSFQPTNQPTYQPNTLPTYFPIFQISLIFPSISIHSFNIEYYFLFLTILKIEIVADCPLFLMRSLSGKSAD